jgi:hypothetical protein
MIAATRLRLGMERERAGLFAALWVRPRGVWCHSV